MTKPLQDVDEMVNSRICHSFKLAFLSCCGQLGLGLELERNLEAIQSKVLIEQMSKLRPNEGRCFGQDHTSGRAKI